MSLFLPRHCSCCCNVCIQALIPTCSCEGFLCCNGQSLSIYSSDMPEREITKIWHNNQTHCHSKWLLNGWSKILQVIKIGITWFMTIFISLRSKLVTKPERDTQLSSLLESSRWWITHKGSKATRTSRQGKKWEETLESETITFFGTFQPPSLSGLFMWLYCLSISGTSR